MKKKIFIKKLKEKIKNKKRKNKKIKNIVIDNDLIPDINKSNMPSSFSGSKKEIKQGIKLQADQLPRNFKENPNEI